MAFLSGYPSPTYDGCPSSTLMPPKLKQPPLTNFFFKKLEHQIKLPALFYPQFDKIGHRSFIGWLTGVCEKGKDSGEEADCASERST